MVNKPKIKGTAAESAFVSWLQDPWFPHAERRSLKGSQDKGDVTGCPGLVFEVKDQARWHLAAWMLETECERVNAGADYGILIMKPPGVGYQRVANWAAVMYQGALADLLGTSSVAVFNTFFQLSGMQINQARTTFKHYQPQTLTMIKPKGIQDTRYFYCLTRVNDMLKAINLAGYGSTASNLWEELLQ